MPKGATRESSKEFHRASPVRLVGVISRAGYGTNTAARVEAVCEKISQKRRGSPSDAVSGRRRSTSPIYRITPGRRHQRYMIVAFRFRYPKPDWHPIEKWTCIAGDTTTPEIVTDVKQQLVGADPQRAIRDQRAVRPPIAIGRDAR